MTYHRTNWKAFCAAISTIMALATSSYADQSKAPDPAKPKSIVAAVLLGLDPLPGDSLLYAGKGGQALGSVVFTVVGAGLFLSSLKKGLERIGCDDSSSCARGSDNTTPWIGLTLLGAGYLWDFFGGIIGTVRHNQSLKRQIRPLVSVDPDGAAVGLSLDF